MGRFVKGHKKLGGKVKLDPVMLKARKFDRENYEMIQHRVSQMSLEELRAMAKNPASTVLEVAIASVWAKGIQKGDVYPLEVFTDRMIGRVSHTVSITGLTFADLMKQQKTKLEEFEQSKKKDGGSSDVDGST